MLRIWICFCFCIFFFWFVWFLEKCCLRSFSYVGLKAETKYQYCSCKDHDDYAWKEHTHTRIPLAFSPKFIGLALFRNYFQNLNFCGNEKYSAKPEEKWKIFSVDSLVPFICSILCSFSNRCFRFGWLVYLIRAYEILRLSGWNWSFFLLNKCKNALKSSKYSNRRLYLALSIFEWSEKCKWHIRIFIKCKQWQWQQQ